MELVLFKPGSSYSSGVHLDVQLNDTSSLLVDYIELVSLRFGAQAASTLVDSNRSSGQPEISSITLSKYFDQSSIALYEACLTQAPLDATNNLSEILILRSTGETQMKVLTIELANAVVSSFDTQTQINDMTLETFTLSFTGIQWKSSISGNINELREKTFGWDVSKNMPYSL